jgi:hypothetical protein
VSQLALFTTPDLTTLDGTPAVAQVCQPCKTGQHIDHHEGVWVKADGSDPVVCPCDRCGGLERQRRYVHAMRELRAQRRR